MITSGICIIDDLVFAKNDQNTDLNVVLFQMCNRWIYILRRNFLKHVISYGRDPMWFKLGMLKHPPDYKDVPTPEKITFLAGNYTQISSYMAYTLTTS